MKATVSKVSLATKAPVTKAPVTKAPVTKAPVTKAPVTKAPVTKRPNWLWAVVVALIILALLIAFWPRRAAAPVTAAPVTAAPAAVQVIEVIEVADSVFNFDGNVPAYSDFRAAVRQPGDTAVFVWNFNSGIDNAVIRRIWPDDILVKATLYVPGQDPKDITAMFGMFFVPAGGTGDAQLDKTLQDRGVNIVAGEILQQNKYAVSLGNVPAGSKLVFEIMDDMALAVNRGIGIVIDNNPPDAFTK